MDPSIILCKVHDSFGTKPLTPAEIMAILPRAYHPVTFPVLIGDIRVALEREVPNLPPDSRICDPQRYDALQKRKDKFATYPERVYMNARNEANPFERIGRSIFLDRAAIKIANSDAIYRLTSPGNLPIPTFLNMSPTSSPGYSPLLFADIASGPGAFTEYIQFRRPDAYGYGMTLTTGNENLDWRKDRIDVSRMKFLYGDDHTGNLYTQWKSFVRDVKIEQPNGVDLVTGDGGFDIENAEIIGEATLKSIEEQKSFNFCRQEFLCERLLLTQILVGINLTKVGGIFFCKIFDTVTTLTAQLLYVLSLCFDEISILKPMSSRPANTERYLICKGRRGNIESYSTLLENMNDAYKPNTVVTSILDVKTDIDAEFLIWLRDQNDLSLTRQEEAITAIESILEGKLPTLPKYNLHRALILWNLPDTPPSRFIGRERREERGRGGRGRGGRGGGGGRGRGRGRSVQ